MFTRSRNLRRPLAPEAEDAGVNTILHFEDEIVGNDESIEEELELDEEAAIAAAMDHVIIRKRSIRSM